MNERRGNLSTEVTNGNLTGGVSLPVDGSCWMNSVNGNITLTVPRTSSAEVTASVTNGTVSVNNLQLLLRTSSWTSLSGTLGDGKGSIQLTTVNGTVVLSGS